MQTEKNTRTGNSLGVRLAVINFVLVTFILLSLVLGLAWGVTRSISRISEDSLSDMTRVMDSVIQTADSEVRAHITDISTRFAANLQGQWELDTSGDTPQLWLDGRVMDSTHPRFESFARLGGAQATVFAKHGDQYIRVATNMRDAQGQPITGTLLDSASPALAMLRTGQTYTGISPVQGKQYIAEYRPLKDAQGKDVGALYVGLDFTTEQENVKAILRSITVGKTGYFYVLDSTPGPNFGTAIVHKTREGKNIADLKDANGWAFVREILEKKNGYFVYHFSTTGDNSQAKDHLAAYSTYAPWNWTYVATADADELLEEAHKLTLLSIIAGLIGVAALTGIWMYLINKLVTQPLKEASRVMDAMAQGDMTMRAKVERHDEIGHLIENLNNTTDNISEVVSTVRSRAETVAMASAEIAQGNQDLSSRTESQASALQETAAAMEELGSTVAHNADHAKTADQLTQEVQRVVTEGGHAVREVVKTMQSIDESGKKIGDIIGVIDGIAFQTNILALNAAVEAARAGEHGRGFAVVAGEVRSLAQRSAEAAKEIKQLITTNVAEIEQGNVRATRAGDTMNQAIEEIKKVTSLISSISNASVEQSNGVSQAAEAVTNMDQTTQQNAAMVEEMAASAQTLRQQADELVQSVSIFKLGNRSNAGYAAPRPTAARHTTKPAPTTAPQPAAAKPAAPAASPTTAATHTTPAAAAHTPPPRPAAEHKALAPAAKEPKATPSAAAPKAGAEDDWESF